VRGVNAVWDRAITRIASSKQSYGQKAAENMKVDTKREPGPRVEVWFKGELDGAKA
jgi:hypothetical protein